MKIEINIEDQLEEIWRDLGLKPSDIDKEYQILNDRVQELFKQFLKENYQRRQILFDEVETTQQEISEIKKKFNIPPRDDADFENLTLVERAQSLTLELKTLQASTVRQRHEFESLFGQLTQCFEILEIEDRGDFSELGDDYSKEKIERMSKFLEKMKSDIEERKPEMEQLFNDLQNLHEILRLEPLEDTGKLGDQTFDAYELEREQLLRHRDKNYKKCQKLYVEIDRLEQVIGKEDKIEPNYDDVSDAMITALKNKLHQLDLEKETRTPEYINNLKVTLLELWKELHIKVPSKASFPFYYSTQLNKRTLLALENEILRLQTIKQQIQPTLEIINDRQNIIEEYERLQNDQFGNSKRLTNRNTSNSMALLEEERIRKQFVYKLPKLNEQLIPLLEEYHENYGEPLLWDGEDLLEQIYEQQQQMSQMAESPDRKASKLLMSQKEIRNNEKARTGRPLRNHNESNMLGSNQSPTKVPASTSKPKSRRGVNVSNPNKTIL